MATNYADFAEAFDVTPEEEQWLGIVLGLPEEHRNPELLRDLYGVEFDPEVDVLDYPWPGFDYALEKGRFSLFSDDGGSCEETMLPILQAFLHRFRPEGNIAVEFACYCSKLRPGEFGGVAMVIFPDRVVAYGTSAIVDLIREGKL